jgi:hypothetical protein
VKFVWVDSGNNADWVKLAQHEIDGEFYAATDPVPDLRARLTASRNRGHAGGIYTAWNWISQTEDGAAYAEFTNGLLIPIETQLAGKSNSFPKVQLDNENHNPDVILAMARRWRQLQPRKDTSWTFEGFQGGWMSAQFVEEMISLRIRIVPQLYSGDMRLHFDALTAARDLTKRGFPDSLISPFYDAAALPYGWQGWAFTAGRLP